jgi:tRNA(fMet)-specific endonuclease VapC
VSFYVLDTDMLSLLQHGHEAVQRKISAVASLDLATTIITVEEQLTGWTAALRKAKGAEEVARVYARFTATVQALSRLRILSFTEPAIKRYDDLVALKLNIGKMDLRIAAIALEHGAVLVTRNARDFQRVPGLSIEDWTV